jgi:hypothetical protein
MGEGSVTVLCAHTERRPVGGGEVFSLDVAQSDDVLISTHSFLSCAVQYTPRMSKNIYSEVKNRRCSPLFLGKIRYKMVRLYARVRFHPR